MIPTIVEKQILNSLRTNKLKKTTNREELTSSTSSSAIFVQTVTHAQKELTAHGPQIASKLRYCKLVSCDQKSVSCDHKLVSCNSKLVSCNHKLVSCDGKIDVSLMSHRRRNPFFFEFFNCLFLSSIFCFNILAAITR